MRKNGRSNMYPEDYYNEVNTAYMWISSKISGFVEKIRQRN